MEYRKLSELKNWDQNPRSIREEDFDRLKNQIKKLGQYKPLIITKENVVLGGNMRLRAYRELGVEEVWVSVVDAKTDEEKLQYALSDNDRAGSYNEEQLAELISGLPDLDLSDFRLDLGKLTTVNELLSKFGPDGDEDEAPELDGTSEPISKYGEVYQLGRHRLMCGDSTKSADLDTLMDGKLADMVWTDPPYNIKYEGAGLGKREGILNDHMSSEAFSQFLKDAIQQLFLSTKDHAPFYICMSSKELGTLKNAFEENKGHWQGFLIWVKNTFTLGGSDYQHQYEPILYGWKEGKHRFFVDERNNSDVWEGLDSLKPKYDGQTTEIKIGGTVLRLNGKVTGEVIRKKLHMDLWYYDKPAKSDAHPTMKPIKLVLHAIRNSSKIDDLVLDTFGGSGSTLMACEQADRTCYTMELDPKYCDVIRKRYAQKIDEENWENEWQNLTPKV